MTPSDIQSERDLARRWWRRLPCDRRAEIARDLSECEFPWQRWFLNPAVRRDDAYLDELHHMATLFEANDSAALEFEPSPMHPDLANDLPETIVPAATRDAQVDLGW